MTTCEWQEKFSERLNGLLSERNMRPSQLASASGLSRSRISDYIHGRVMPNIFAVINMAYALDVQIGDLIDFDERVCD